ncbi:MAG: HupE/UreJ family protein, partial [Alphaproteobacteria bacterium]|nr:HupE/UreJ family protein [Alphaproteobacteria bacterium]
VLLAAGFGLAHGAGFAGALIELEIAPERLWRALLGFNIGVELAQLAALGVIGVLALALRPLPIAARHGAMAATCAALAAIGSYWFVSRTLG